MRAILISKEFSVKLKLSFLHMYKCSVRHLSYPMYADSPDTKGMKKFNDCVTSRITGHLNTKLTGSLA